MKNLYTIVISGLFTCLLFSATLYSSCGQSNKCDDITCQNGGTCKDGACVCPDGFTGTLCETKTDDCAGINCLNGGNCVGGKCICPPGFTGPRCETDLCIGVVCNNGGTCVSGKCQCATGYEGDKCDSLVRKRYLGIWLGKSTCGGSNTDSIVVTASGDVGVSVYFASGNTKFTVGPGIANGALQMNDMQYMGPNKMVAFSMTATGATATYSYLISNLQTGIGVHCSGTAVKK